MGGDCAEDVGSASGLAAAFACSSKRKRTGLTSDLGAARDYSAHDDESRPDGVRTYVPMTTMSV